MIQKSVFAGLEAFRSAPNLHPAMAYAYGTFRQQWPESHTPSDQPKSRKLVAETMA